MRDDDITNTLLVRFILYTKDDEGFTLKTMDCILTTMDFIADGNTRRVHSGLV